MKNKLVLATLAFALSLSGAWAQSAKYSTNLSAYVHQAEMAARHHRAPVVGQGELEANSFRAMLVVTDAAVAQQSLQALGISSTPITSTMLSATLCLNQLEAVASIAEISSIEMGAPAQPCLVLTREETGVNRLHSTDVAQNALGQAYTGKGVVLGIVDSGFEYGHAAFYDKDGNYRVKRVWNQLVSNGRTPAQFDYGIEYTTPTEILNAKTDTPTGTHGTHVAGIAGGSDVTSDYTGVATDAEFVLVAVKANTTSSYIVDGVKYIFDYANSVGKPCVINLSLGSHYGPHDGTSVTDRAFAELTGPGRLIVGSVGNEGDMKIHVGKTFAEGDTQLKSAYGFSNANNMHSLIDIWGDPGKSFKVTCAVVDNLKGKVVYEAGTILSTEEGNQLLDYTNAESGATGTFYATVKPNNSNGCHNIYVENNCSSIGGNRKLALIVEGEAGSSVHMWNCTGDPFIACGGLSWTAGTSAYSAGEIGGTSPNVISVGAYGLRDRYTDLLGDTYTLPGMGEAGNIAFFSSQGPTRDGRVKPDVVAPGVLVNSAVSKLYYNDRYTMEALSSGLNSDLYFYYPLSGTSMSSPLVAGVVACWLEANPTLTPDKCREIIAQSSRQDKFTGVLSPCNSISGYGKIDAYRGLLYATGHPELDGIHTVTFDQVAAYGRSYDLQGRCTQGAVRGLIIENGSKMLR